MYVTVLYQDECIVINETTTISAEKKCKVYINAPAAVKIRKCQKEEKLTQENQTKKE